MALPPGAFGPESIPFWDVAGSQVEFPLNPWDVVKLNGERLPGACRVSGKKGRRIDKKKVPGRDGATPNHLGYDPAEIIIQVRMWTPDHLARWMELLPKLQPVKGADALSVEHPALALQGITSLYVADISLPEEQGRGVRHVTMVLTEYKPGKGDVTKPLVPSIESLGPGRLQAPATTRPRNRGP